MKRWKFRDWGPVAAWCCLGLGLRLFGLGSKPAWSDEWATLVFSLGHSFRSIPLDQLISLDTLLAPARLDAAGPAQVVQSLMAESTHPPLYFLLSHGWIHLWQKAGDWVDLGVARSLSALFGVCAIPAAYGLAWVTTRSRSIALTATALMAVSPFGIYLAQDARHYTLALLFSMVSISSFVAAWRSLGQSLDETVGESVGQGVETLRLKTVALWVSANLLGLATHYFTGLLLAAQVVALVGRGLWLARQRRSFDSVFKRGQPIAAAVVLTLLGALPWSIFLVRIPGDRLTEWIQRDPSSWAWLEPPLRLIAAIGSMVGMPAVEAVPVGVAIASGVPLLVATLWLSTQLAKPSTHLPSTTNPTAPVLTALLTLLVTELVIILGITYGLQRDLTLGARYLFGLLPVVGLILAIATQNAQRPQQVKQVLILLGLVGSLCVHADVAYRKPDQSRLLAQAIQTTHQQALQSPNQTQAQAIVIGGVYKTHEQVSELMSIAYEWRRMAQKSLPESLPEPMFILAQRQQPDNLVTHAFQPGFVNISRPADLWLVNLAANLDLWTLGCQTPPLDKVQVNGYRAKHHRCPVPEALVPGSPIPGAPPLPVPPAPAPPAPVPPAPAPELP